MYRASVAGDYNGVVAVIGPRLGSARLVMKSNHGALNEGAASEHLRSRRRRRCRTHRQKFKYRLAHQPPPRQQSAGSC